MINIRHRLQASITLCLIFLLLPACQLINQKHNSSASYGEYYLTLQQLNQQQLHEEVLKQQANVEQQKLNNIGNDYDPQLKLLLLYSLPKSPIYNSFNAKVMLNEMTRAGGNAAFADINPSEQAFITLLRDQLNQRLLMRNRLLAQQQEQQQQLAAQVQLLEQTIKQLKNIEQAIDKREQ